MQLKRETDKINGKIMTLQYVSLAIYLVVSSFHASAFSVHKNERVDSVSVLD